MKQLTYEQAHRIAIQPLPHLPTVAYTGKIWGGVQITDAFMRETAEEILLSGYEGLYSDLLNDLEDLNTEIPFHEMLIEDI